MDVIQEIITPLPPCTRLGDTRVETWYGGNFVVKAPARRRRGNFVASIVGFGAFGANEPQ